MRFEKPKLSVFVILFGPRPFDEGNLIAHVNVTYIISTYPSWMKELQ